jgi:hypothetical protein
MQIKLITKANNYDYDEHLPYNKQTLNSHATVFTYFTLNKTGEKSTLSTNEETNQY